MNEDTKDNLQDKADNLGSYASRHPRRMWASAFLMGMGAGLMASKTRKEKSGFQKFLDNFGE